MSGLKEEQRQAGGRFGNRRSLPESILGQDRMWVTAVSNLAGTTSYAYDNRNQLVEVSNASSPTVEFVYDSNGTRVEKRVGGPSTYFEYDSRGNLVLEVNPDNTIKVKYIRGNEGRALAMQQNGATYYFLYNGHGDVTGVINGSGNVVATYKYDEFGNLLASTGSIHNPMRYSAANNAYFDGETGLYLMGARYYNPAFGRWMTRDQSEALDLHPATYWAYAYCENGPLNAADPTGFAKKVLNVKVFGQKKSLWCWAAVSRMVLIYKKGGDPAKAPTQEKIVRHVYGDLRNAGLAMDNGTKKCVRGLLHDYGVWAGFDPQAESFANVKWNINRNYKGPIIASIQRTYYDIYGNPHVLAHMEVVRGYSHYTSGGKEYKYVCFNDPWPMHTEKWRGGRVYWRTYGQFRYVNKTGPDPGPSGYEWKASLARLTNI